MGFRADLLVVLETAGIGRATLAGMSEGGYTELRVAPTAGRPGHGPQHERTRRSDARHRHPAPGNAAR
ncbi:hypothetical protein D5S18_25070 [Nocardia panacis]|uniref:Uncharacterized protein n=1 Tax=Nocardia panacis TaxID=2340916 RepID=A0A3A4K3X6_9NOCA|nr:hypothetical protein [Nocardia panacis]RJO71443.1 hypothetical protein D5S18_25070 [Nocardia panacis]